MEGKAAPPAVPRPPKFRHITSWIRRRPDNLDADEQLKLKKVRAACPHLDALRGHVEEFAKMLTGRDGESLDAWIAAVRGDDLPHLYAFSNGLERDHAAVLAVLTLPYSSGAVEGKICEIKFLKRLMFGPGQLRLAEKDDTAELSPSGSPTVTAPHQAHHTHLPVKVTGSSHVRKISE